MGNKRKSHSAVNQNAPMGLTMLSKIAQDRPKAFPLYRFLAENLKPHTGAIVCDQKFLSEYFNVSIRTIQRWLDMLEEIHAILKIPVGQTYAYVLEPKIVWEGFNTGGDYAQFNTTTLTERSTERNQQLKEMMLVRGMIGNEDVLQFEID